MKLNIKSIAGSITTIDNLEETNTILQVKEKLQEIDSEKKVELLKFIAFGKILENSTTLKDNNLQDDTTIFVIVSKTPTNNTTQPVAQPSTTIPTISNETNIPVNNNETTIPPNMFGQMPNNFNPYNVLNNEQINTFLQNPQFMNMMNQMMNDPEVCSLMMESMMNPALLNDPTFMQRLTSNQNYMQLLANNMGIFNMNNMFGQMPSANFNSTNNTFSNTNVSNPNNSTNQYEKEIDEMVELGFPNRASNLQALQLCNGDVNRAINMLLDIQ